MTLLDTIETTAWAMHHFGAICTGREIKMRDIKNAQSKGLIESVGLVPLADGDGFTLVPERYREGFKLTEKGEEYLREHAPETAAVYLENVKVDASADTATPKQNQTL